MLVGPGPTPEAVGRQRCKSRVATADIIKNMSLYASNVAGGGDELAMPMPMTTAAAAPFSGAFAPIHLAMDSDAALPLGEEDRDDWHDLHGMDGMDEEEEDESPAEMAKQMMRELNYRIPSYATPEVDAARADEIYAAAVSKNANSNSNSNEELEQQPGSPEFELDAPRMFGDVEGEEFAGEEEEVPSESEPVAATPDPARKMLEEALEAKLNAEAESFMTNLIDDDGVQRGPSLVERGR